MAEASSERGPISNLYKICYQETSSHFPMPTESKWLYHNPNPKFPFSSFSFSSSWSSSLDLPTFPTRLHPSPCLDSFECRNFDREPSNSEASQSFTPTRNVIVSRLSFKHLPANCYRPRLELQPQRHDQLLSLRHNFAFGLVESLERFPARRYLLDKCYINFFFVFFFFLFLLFLVKMRISLKKMTVSPARRWFNPSQHSPSASTTVKKLMLLFQPMT